MNSRLILCFLFLFLLFENSKSFGNNDEPVIHWGNPLPKSGRANYTKILGNWNQQILLLKQEKGNLFESAKWSIDFFSEGNNTLIESSHIPLSLDNSDELELNDILIFEEKIICLSSIKQRKIKKIDLYLSTLEKGQEKFSTQTLLKSIPLDIETENEGDYLKLISFGSHFFLLYPSSTATNGKQIELVQVIDNGQLSNIKSIPLPDNHRNVEIGEIHFASDSTLFFSLKNIRENISYSLVSFRITNNKTNIAELEIPKMNISSIRLLVENDLLYVGGFLKEKKKNAAPSAFFTAGFDTELNVIHQLSYSEFGKLKEKGLNNEKEKNKEWPDLKALGIMKVKDGIFLIGEQQRTDNICISDFRTGFIRCNNYYYFVDLLCIYTGFNQNSWKTSVHKYQSSIDDFGIFGSVILTSDRDSSCMVVFNDHKKNILHNSSEVKIMNNPSKSHCVAVSIDTNGKIRKFNLYSSREQNIILIPSMHKPKRNKEIYVYGERSGVSRIGLLSLP